MHSASKKDQMMRILRSVLIFMVLMGCLRDMAVTSAS